MHIFLQIVVKEKTLKVLPTKLLVGADGGKSRSNERDGEEGWESVLTKCMGISRKTLNIVL